MPPIMMASGAMPAMTVSGAAAATTKNTIEPVPSAPCSRRSGAVAVDWDTGLLLNGMGNRGRTGRSVGAGAGEPGAQYGQVAQVAGRDGGRVGGEVDQVGAHAGAQHAPAVLLERLVRDAGGVGGERGGRGDALGGQPAAVRVPGRGLPGDGGGDAVQGLVGGDRPVAAERDTGAGVQQGGGLVL